MTDIISKITILSDEPTKKPTKGFDRLAEIVSRTIVDSAPEFTIGLYGNWGTGKTTLMNAIRNEFKIKEEKQEEKIEKLKKLFKLIKNSNTTKYNNYAISEKYPTIWFNAWRFEREKAKATIPLIITILERLSLEIENSKKKMIEQTRDEIISFLKGCEYYFEISIPGISFGITRDPNAEKDTSNNNQEIPVPTIQKGLDLITKMIKTLTKINKNFRIIVFIDDLDRCSPQTTLEVFESVKVLLNIKGIIYIIGLSHNTINKLINKEYEFAGISGDEYIQKIIQLPVWVPTWQIENLSEFIQSNILEQQLGIDSEYSKILKGKERQLLLALDHNPREVKRFINSFIFSFEIFKSQNPEQSLDEKAKEQFLIVKLINYRWKEIYEILVNSEPKQRKLLIKMIKNIAYCKNSDDYERLIGEWSRLGRNSQ